jgi:hypothetical protein
MKIAICDSLGLCYDGDTLSKQGLGGSESAVILIAENLQQIGFQVTVFNNCKDGANSKPGIFSGVRYIDNTDAKTHQEKYDLVVVSRTVTPFVSQDWPFPHTAKKRNTTCLMQHIPFSHSFKMKTMQSLCCLTRTAC